MKKIFYMFSLLVASMSFVACSDSDSNAGSSDGRMFMTMFRQDDNTGAGTDDEFRCKNFGPNGNNIHLAWYAVEGAAGYEIMWSQPIAVANGEKAWLETDEEGNLTRVEGTKIVKVDPNMSLEQQAKLCQLDLENMAYETDYRFAIRVLSPKGEGYHSKWYGFGEGRQWADYCSVVTSPRYDVPTIISVGDKTKTSFKVYLDRSTSSYNASQITSFKNHFSTLDGDSKFKVDYMVVSPSMSTPDGKVPEKFKHYPITQADWDNGFVEVTDLDENTMYVVDVADENIEVYADATFNPISVRTAGTIGDPIPVQWIPTLIDDVVSLDGVYAKGLDISKFGACKLDGILNDYMKSTEIAEGTTFLLEGGKKYVMTESVSLYKGFTLKTDPATLATDGPATVYFSGMGKTQSNQIAQSNFMLGRQAEVGENSLVQLAIGEITFEDINFDCPYAANYGDQQKGHHLGQIPTVENGQTVMGSSTCTNTGNYFMNMYSNGLGFILEGFTIRNCTFQRMVRGFFRVQGSHVKQIKKFYVQNCDFYNCGYYDNNGAGYAWINGDGAQAQSNIYGDMLWEENTIFDSPRAAFFTDNTKDLNWPESVKYKITFRNNTLVNMCARSGSRYFFNLNYLPVGSEINIYNNVFVTAQSANSSFKLANVAGMRDMSAIKNVTTSSGEAYCNIYNNWCTSDNAAFPAKPFSGKKAFLTSLDNQGGGFKWIYGPETSKATLDPQSVGLTAAELFVNGVPNPQGEATTSPYCHYAEGIDGSGTGKYAIDLHFKNLDNDIVKNNAGATKWYKGSGKSSSKKAAVAKYLLRH